MTTTLESMEALADSVWSPQHGGRAQALRERWAAFEPGDTESSSAAFAAAEARVSATLEAHASPSAGAAPSGFDPEGGSGSGAVSDAPTGTSTRGASGSGGTAGAANASASIGDAAAGAAPTAAPTAAPAAAGTATGAPPPPPDAASVALAERLRMLEIDALPAAVDGEPSVGPSVEPSDGAAGSVAAGVAPEPDAAGSPLSEALRAHARAVAVLFDPPFDHQRARPAALRQRLARVDALLDTGTLLPGLDLTAHRYVQALGEHRAALAERLGKSEQESADRIKATHRQFAALGGIIGEGKWAPANSLLKRLQKKLAAMEPAERSGLDDKLARAEQQLAEMGDWQDFAARPKLEALCVEMEALPGRELVPAKLSKAVRDLQSQWKSLGPSRAANELWPRFKTAGDTAYEPCKAYFAAKGEERQAKIDARRGICESLEADVSMLGNALVVDAPPEAPPEAQGRRGGGTDAADDSGDGTATEDAPPPAVGASPDEAGGAAVAADGAADVAADGATADGSATAEAPADESSSGDGAPDGSSAGDASGGGSDTDGDAAETRTVHVDPDGPEPDWKAVQRRVGDAKREWSRNRVTDRKPDKALEARFSAALKPYERALSTRYAANEAAKRALIERAEALAGGEITQHVANQAKTLLSAWKQVGIMPRRVDQKLWETFNGHLGTVFRHQQAVVREKRRAGLEHVERARAIARELRALAKGDSVDEGAVQALADEFHALADFPERDRRGLERDFRAALDATARVQETAGKRRRQAEREERLRLVELCERLEAAVEENQTDETAATLIEDVKHAWEASETRVTRDMGVRLEARRDAALAHLAEGRGFDLAANEEARRDLLIRMEVAADVETPPDDKSRRMRYQLENLQAGMTSAGVADRRATLAALEEQWLAAPPASRAVADALNSRFLKAQGR